MNDTRKEDYIQALSDIDCAQEYLKKTIACAVDLFKQYKDMPHVAARNIVASKCTDLEYMQKELNSVVNLNCMQEAINDIQNNYSLAYVIKDVQEKFDDFATAYQWVYMELKDNDYGDNENFKALREALCIVGDLINDDCETWGISEAEEE